MWHQDIVDTLTSHRHIIMCGWGTGWHVYPISSLIQYIESNSKVNSKIKKIFRCWQTWSIEEAEYHRIQNKMSQTDLSFLIIISGKIRRYVDLQNIILNTIDIFKIIIGTIQSIYYIIKYDIDAVFSKGWYVAWPMIIASILMQKTLYIHESDSHYGLAHRLWYRHASRIWIGTQALKSDQNPKIVYSGQIFAPDLLHPHNQAPESLMQLKKTYPNAYSIIVTPWSLGSQTLYEQLLPLIPQMWEQYIWYIVCGRLNTSYVKKFCIYPYIYAIEEASRELMWHLYRHAQWAIVRWGITTLAECQYFGLKTLAIPLQNTHDQADNVKYYVQSYPWQFFCRHAISIEDIRQIFI